MPEQPTGLPLTAPHAQPADAVLSQLGVTGNGLSPAEAQRRLDSHGFNRLPEPPKTHPLLRFMRHFHNVLIYVLLGSALVTLLLDHYTDTAVILAVVLINAVIGFVQEGRAEQAMNAIRRMLAPVAAVVRDGQRLSVAGETLVPGDIVLLEAGDRVPADLRLLSGNALQIQEAILTGESVAVMKQQAPVDHGAALGDRACMAYSGTLVTSGQGRGVVVATGAHTEIGRVSGLLARVEPLVTPLVAQMAIFARWLTLVILAVAVGLLLFGHFVQDYPFADLFLAVVGLSVAAIPEGLPAVLTITLSVGVQTIARRNVIVRRLPAIETLGAVSVICSDKTGTLTRNEMMVVAAATGGATLSITGTGYAPGGAVSRGTDVVDPDGTHPYRHLAFAAALCNDAAIREQADGWIVEGDPMEGALLAFACKLGIGAAERQHWQRTDLIPFDPRHRYMATLNHDHEHHAAIFVKGAPEKLLALCEYQTGADGSPQPLCVDAWHRQVADLSAQGQRVLALAMKPVDVSHTVLESSDLKQGLILLGLVGLIDPPRAEVIDAITECRRAGIQVKMITGDHAGTAAAIGRQIGLDNPDQVLTGDQLDDLNDDDLAARVLQCNIFARTSPEHKLRLVMALQAHNMTVAMTGDGVNDAPALKRADAGVAMGQKGSEAAREAAELVLADDNFASIVAAVREGRTVYDNIKKVISWTLPTNAAEALTVVIALLLGLAMPITAIQILWINLVTAVTLGMALAFEPTEANTMRRPPRHRSEALLSGDLPWQILFVASLFVLAVYGIFSHALSSGHSETLARTLALNTLVVLEIVYLFYIRNIYGTSLRWDAVKGTPVIWATVISVTLAQFAITYVPALQQIFGTESVPLAEGIKVIAIGVVLFLVIELEKQVRLRLRQRSRMAAERLS